MSSEAPEQSKSILITSSSGSHSERVIITGASSFLLFVAGVTIFDTFRLERGVSDILLVG